MLAASNLSSTRRTVRALRKQERVTEANAALAQLVLTTAGALDDVLSSGEKRYVVAALARSHLLALQALLSTPEVAGPDGFDAFLRDLATPRRTDDDAPPAL
jgi:hypothetical protein